MNVRSREHARVLLAYVPPIMHWLRSEVRRAMPGGLTLLQFRILSHMSRGARTTSELSDRMGITLPALSRAIDSMVKKLWVARSPSSVDRRTTLLSLTASGRKVFRNAQGEVEAQLGIRLSEMGLQDSERFTQGLDAILEVQRLLTVSMKSFSTKTTL